MNQTQYLGAAGPDTPLGVLASLSNGWHSLHTLYRVLLAMTRARFCSQVVQLDDTCTKLNIGSLLATTSTCTRLNIWGLLATTDPWVCCQSIPTDDMGPMWEVTPSTTHNGCAVFMKTFTCDETEQCSF